MRFTCPIAHRSRPKGECLLFATESLATAVVYVCVCQICHAINHRHITEERAHDDDRIRSTTERVVAFVILFMPAIMWRERRTRASLVSAQKHFDDVLFPAHGVCKVCDSIFASQLLFISLFLLQLLFAFVFQAAKTVSDL